MTEKAVAAEVKSQIVRRKLKAKASEIFGFPIGKDQVDRFEDWHPRLPPPLHQLDNDYAFDEDTVKLIVYALQEGENLILVGDHGSGKTSHLFNVLLRLQYGFIQVSCNEEMEVSNLIGYTKLGPQGFQFT